MDIVNQITCYRLRRGGNGENTPFYPVHQYLVVHIVEASELLTFTFNEITVQPRGNMPCGYLVQMRCVYPPFVFAKFLEGKYHKGGKINNVMLARRGTRTICPFFQLDKLIIVFFQPAEARDEALPLLLCQFCRKGMIFCPCSFSTISVSCVSSAVMVIILIEGYMITISVFIN